jgi:hypothetical protein
VPQPQYIIFLICRGKQKQQAQDKRNVKNAKEEKLMYKRVPRRKTTNIGSN